MKKHLKPGALLAPLPAVLVTVGDAERANLLTVGWCGILSTHPPRTYISVRPSRYSHTLLQQRGEFVINLTRASQARAVDYAGIYTGAKVDKLAALGFTAEPSAEVAPPTIAECPMSLECRVIEVRRSGTHDVFVADIVSVSCDEELIDKEGKIRLDRADLLVYAHGEYYGLGRCLGHFGFSTAKGRTERAGGSGKAAKTAPRVEKNDFGRPRSGKFKEKESTVGKSRSAKGGARAKLPAVPTENGADAPMAEKEPFYKPFIKKGRGGYRK